MAPASWAAIERTGLMSLPDEMYEKEKSLDGDKRTGLFPISKKAVPA